MLNIQKLPKRNKETGLLKLLKEFENLSLWNGFIPKYRTVVFFNN
jgi:hypothetical protein